MAAGSTYTKIASNTLSSTATSVTFSSIPQTYTDLRIVAALSLTANNNAYVLFNGDGGENYSITYIQGAGGSVASSRVTPSSYGYVDFAGTTAQHTVTVDIMNYSNATTYKTWLSRGGNAASLVIAYVGTWRNTAAITTVGFANDGGILAGTTISLYGIAAA